MRIKILDRILVAVAGIILIAGCTGLVCQVFFGKNIIGFTEQQLSRTSTTAKIVIGAIALFLLLLGIYCFLLLFRHHGRKDKFIRQRMENGELAISLDTLESMVKKCLDMHPEIKSERIRMENMREGLLIRINGVIAGGISIPLTVDNLQKQIKQYVTACSGVEVKAIRIQIEASGEDAKDAPFLIDGPANMLLPRGAEQKENIPAEESTSEEIQTSEQKENPVELAAEETPAQSEAAAAAAAMAAAENLKNEIEEDDDRPLHQRLFSTQEEPCIMPLPPVDLAAETPESFSKTEETTAEKTDKSGSFTLPDEAEEVILTPPETMVDEPVKPEEPDQKVEDRVEENKEADPE